MAYFINNFLKFVFLLTPFFVLSMFLSMTQGWAMRQKRLLALRIGIAAFCTCMILLFFGKWIFEAFDITLDAFRIGGGALLFLSAVGLVNGKVEDKKPLAVEDDSEESHRLDSCRNGFADDLHRCPQLPRAVNGFPGLPGEQTLHQDFNKKVVRPGEGRMKIMQCLF